MGKPLQYEDLTEDQINLIWNGVGSSHFFIDPHDLIFKEPSKKHDFYYWRGGTEEHKKEADLIFYKECKEKVNEHEGLAWLFYSTAAWTYYQFVKHLGKYSFEYADKPAETWKEIYKRWEAYQEQNS